jgi:hypothetical protein
LASPSRRTVSFSQQQQQQQQQQRYEHSPSPATPFRTGAGAEWSSSRDAPSSSQLPKRADGVMASTSSSTTAAQPRRPRSPTPPSSAYSLSLPIMSSRASASSAPLDASTLSQTLAHLITRYAALAGYAAIEPAALDYLQESIDVYIESVLLQSLESALLGGRTDPSVRDVLGGLSWREQEEEEEKEDNGEEDGGEKDAMESREGDEHKRLPPLARYVSRLVTWRHNVPDYYDERTPAAVAEVDASARWAKSTEVDAFLGVGADDKNVEELLTRKSRYLEKTQRDEIPSHLPELPAVHTWRRSANTPSAGDGPAASTTLSRLETRLVSSRLVQSSLGSLIGRLEGVGSAGLTSTAIASQDRQDGTAADSSAAVTQASKVKEDMTPSSSPTTATAPLSRPGNRSLSVRLRPQSVSSMSAFAAPESPAATTGEPATKRRRGLSEYDHTLHLDFRGQHHHPHAQSGFPASPLGLSTPGSASASHTGAFHFPLQQHRRAGSLVVSPAVSTPGLGGMAGAGGGYPWSNPLMSPVTPLSASGPGGRYFPAAPPVGIGATQDLGDLGMRRSSSALHSPSMSVFDFGAAGEGGETVSAGMTVLPPIVNFKAGWYAKKG